MSSRDSPSSELSEHSSPSSISSPSHSPKFSKSSAMTTSNSRIAKSTSRSGGGAQRRRGPGFIVRPRSQSVIVGERISLKCSLLGHPKPTVTWEKDGELVDEDRTNGHIRTIIDGNNYQLVVEGAELKDAGKYAVTARNSLGKQTAAVDVVVTGNEVEDGDMKQSNVNGGLLGHHKTNKLRHPLEIDVHNSSRTYQHMESPYKQSGMSKYSIDADSKQISQASIVPPTFLRRLSSIQVLEGEELLLQCEISGDPIPRVSWKRNGVAVGVDESEVFTSFREGVARLRLRDVQSCHAGEYICEARNAKGAVQCSSRVTVKARRVEMRPKFIRAPSDIRTVEGETVSIEAELEGVPTPEVVWSLDGEELSGAETSFRGNVARLLLRNVTRANSGQYVCSALNSRGEDSVACRVRIRSRITDIPPSFVTHLADVSTCGDDDIILRCSVAGAPEPTVEWMYNEEVITSEDGVDIAFHDGTATLTVEQATQEDSGCYKCIASNKAGKAVSQCTVIVKERAEPLSVAKVFIPPKFVSPFDEYIRIQEGDSLALECEITGNPIPKVMWTINDKKVENARTEMENARARLEIPSITSSHSGRIKCTISNEAGEESCISRIHVRAKRVAPAFVSLLPEFVDIFEDEEAHFECKVTGHPQPRVAWSRDGKSLSVLSAETSYENGVAAVRIRKASSHDAGRYSCVARNLSGEVESVCRVKFNAKGVISARAGDDTPWFSQPLRDASVEDGDDLFLECHVTGNPIPEVTWLVDGERIHPEDADARFECGVARLILEDVMPEDSGVYQCVAKNRAGESNCSCRIAVKAKKTEQEARFEIGLEDRSAKQGQDVVLRGQVSGDPVPKITWLFNNKELDSGKMNDGVVELRLKKVTRKNEGVYTCVAENSLKKVTSSCCVKVEVPPQIPKKTISPTKQKSSSTRDEANGGNPPSFLSPLADVTVPDGSIDFSLACRVSGNPTARWFHEQEEIEESDDFELISDGGLRKLVFAEIFPDDSGNYTCVVTNHAGEARSTCRVEVQEIDGESPSFVLKPKPATVRVGERAVFTCRVDGDPVPTVHWFFCNQPIKHFPHVRVVDADASNNFTHALHIPETCAQDAGKYSVCCRNLLGDVTCTISLIVDDVKKQETRKDFRDVLKKSPSIKSPTQKHAGEETVDFRSVLRKTSSDNFEKRSADPSEDSSVAFKEVLSNSIKTKALSEEERKAQKAEQKDFRGNLIRKVDTKLVTQDVLRTKGTEQVDFREGALKTKVRTKALGQEDYKAMHPEQIDFRGETIKSKVVTKAFKEEAIKAKKAEQVDFRKVLSPTKRDDQGKFKLEEQTPTISDIPRAKWKKDVDHTTVATRRARHRQPTIAPERKRSREQAIPKFTKPLKDVTVNDSKPFYLECHVTGEPRPAVSWYLEKHEIKSDSDITLTYEGEVCRLSIAECFPEDEGSYTCTATNQIGQISSSCYVTVLED